MQTETEKFAALLRDMGWDDAKAASLLYCDRSAISLARRGKAPVQPRMMALLVDKVMDLCPRLLEIHGIEVKPKASSGLPPIPAWAEGLLDDLLLVDPAAKDSAVEAARKVVQAFPKRSNWQNFANLAGGLSDLKPVEGASSEASFAAEQPPDYKSKSDPKAVRKATLESAVKDIKKGKT